VLVPRAGAEPVRIDSLVETQWAQRIAIADPRGDASGALAEALFGRLGIRRAVDGKLVYVGRTRQVLERLSRGEVDVGFALASELVGPAAAGLQIADRASDDRGARYPIAIVAASPRLVAARQFVDEVLHGEGPRALAAVGLTVPQ
jgi:ABC-type molybdate transport system substrate-binding protein